MSDERTIIVMPAYNAATTLERIVDAIPAGCCDEILLVDDASRDDTVQVARRLAGSRERQAQVPRPAQVPRLTVIEHERNLGYGGNQKTCYREALRRGADYVVMLHPDLQYEARLIPPAIDILRVGACDVVLGNRIRTRQEALDGGMPLVKYLANRTLTIVENILSGQNLGEWHSGFRAYRRDVLETLPLERNSDDFVFDSQVLLQCVHFDFRLGDLPMPVRYLKESSSINLTRSAIYATRTLWTFVAWYAHRAGIVESPLFRKDP